MPAPAVTSHALRVDLGDGDYLFVDSEEEVSDYVRGELEKAARNIKATILTNKLHVSAVEIGPNAGATSGS